MYKSKIGMGVPCTEIPKVIKRVLDEAERNETGLLTNEERIFTDNIPNKSWVYRFVERNGELAARTPEHLGYARKKVSKENTSQLV